MDFTYRPVDVNKYFDKIFYINLDEDQERLDALLYQLNRFNITNVERISGVKYSEILEDSSSWRNFIKDDEKYVIGQLGCRESHLRAIRLAKDRGYSRVLILEDDVLFLNNPSELLTINEWLHNDWDMLYFGGLVEPFFRNQIVCAHAYGVNHTVFDDIINMAIPSGMEIDNFYAKIIQHMSYNHTAIGKYRIRTIQPFNQIVQNKTHESNIQS
jgi:GR25 family glycosyltransferase involved in LPS biosynthesis